MRVPSAFRWVLLLAIILALGSACQRKTGCPANEKVHVQPNRKGQLPTKGGTTNLFPKKMRKKKN